MRAPAVARGTLRSFFLVSVVSGLQASGPHRASAAEVIVKIQESPVAAQFAQQAGLDVPMLEAEVRRELENLFQTYRVADYLRAFGDAQAFASRGMGVDYVSNFQAAMIGVAGNLSLNVERGYLPQETRTRPPAGGVSTNATIMAGLNLDFFGLGPVTLFGNYFSRSGTLEEFAADLSNWGVHAQLKLWAPESENLLYALFRWGGVDLTTGLEHARLKLTLVRDWVRDIPVGPAAGSASMGASSAVVGVASTGRFAIDMRAFSIPIEVTTNFRLLYLLSLYAGFGFDWQLGGGSSLALDLDGTMVGRSGQTMPVDLGTATVEASDSVDPSPGRLRWLLGLQVNVLVVKVFAQLNLATQDPVIASVALGARVAY